MSNSADAGAGSHEGADRPPPPSRAARDVFGAHLRTAEEYAAILADTGVSHGLIGPREVARIWDRHIVNCAVIEDGFPPDCRVIDIGSGAGLPGLALAIVRPDLEVHLVEPMQRRTDWLRAAVEELGLENVTVHRGRAEEFHGKLVAPRVTARAVARIDKLARWGCPLVEDGGKLVALKGRSAPEELEAHRAALRREGVVAAEVTTHGSGRVDPPSITIDLTVDRKAGSTRGGRGKGSGSSRPRTTRGGGTRRAGRRRR